MEAQAALVSHTLGVIGPPRLVGLAMDRTMFDTILPSGKKVRYQVLRIAISRKGRAIPLIQLAYDRDDLPADKSQNHLEQETLLAVVEALPSGARAVVLADRGFHGASFASFIAFLQRHDLDYVVRLKKGSCLTEASGGRWKLGEEELEPGQIRWSPGVRHGLYHDRPRELYINVHKRGSVLEDLQKPGHRSSP